MAAKSIVITQFDRFGEGSSALTLEELDKELSRSNPKSYMGSIHYSIGYEGWKDRLSSMIQNVIVGDED